MRWSGPQPSPPPGRRRVPAGKPARVSGPPLFVTPPGRGVGRATIAPGRCGPSRCLRRPHRPPLPFAALTRGGRASRLRPDAGLRGPMTGLAVVRPPDDRRRAVVAARPVTPRRHQAERRAPVLGCACARRHVARRGACLGAGFAPRVRALAVCMVLPSSLGRRRAGPCAIRPEKQDERHPTNPTAPAPLGRRMDPPPRSTPSLAWTTGPTIRRLTPPGGLRLVEIRDHHSRAMLRRWAMVMLLAALAVLVPGRGWAGGSPDAGADAPAITASAALAREAGSAALAGHFAASMPSGSPVVLIVAPDAWERWALIAPALDPITARGPPFVRGSENSRSRCLTWEMAVFTPADQGVTIYCLGGCSTTCGETAMALSQYYLRARYYDASKGRFQTMDSFEGNADEPLSLQKYTYCANSPIDYIDPTGNDFSLSGIMANLGISTTLRSIATPVSQLAARAAQFVFGRRYTVYFTSSRSLAGIPSHWFLYINDTKNNRGFRYDVGLEDTRAWRRGGALSRYVKVFWAGEFSISATTLNSVKSSSIKMVPFAKFEGKHLAIWSALAVPFGIIEGTADRTMQIPYSIPGFPLTMNCYKWTAEAAVAAFGIQFLP